MFQQVRRFQAEVSRLDNELQRTRSQLEKEQAVIVERISHLPTAEQVAELNAVIREQVATMKTQTKSFDQLGKRLDLVQTYLEGGTPK